MQTNTYKYEDLTLELCDHIYEAYNIVSVCDGDKKEIIQTIEK